MLEGEVLFGASFVEDPDLPDRGTTLLFGWPDPLDAGDLAVAGELGRRRDSDGQTDGEADELDLFEAGEIEGDDSLLAELADELG